MTTKKSGKEQTIYVKENYRVNENIPPNYSNNEDTLIAPNILLHNYSTNRNGNIGKSNSKTMGEFENENQLLKLKLLELEKANNLLIGKLNDQGTDSSSSQRKEYICRPPLMQNLHIPTEDTIRTISTFSDKGTTQKGIVEDLFLNSKLKDFESISFSSPTLVTERKAEENSLLDWHSDERGSKVELNERPKILIYEEEDLGDTATYRKGLLSTSRFLITPEESKKCRQGFTAQSRDYETFHDNNHNNNSNSSPTTPRVGKHKNIPTKENLFTPVQQPKQILNNTPFNMNIRENPLQEQSVRSLQTEEGSPLNIQLNFNNLQITDASSDLQTIIYRGLEELKWAISSPGGRDLHKKLEVGEYGELGEFMGYIGISINNAVERIIEMWKKNEKREANYKIDIAELKEQLALSQDREADHEHPEDTRSESLTQINNRKKCNNIYMESAPLVSNGNIMNNTTFIEYIQGDENSFVLPSSPAQHNQSDILTNLFNLQNICKSPDVPQSEIDLNTFYFHKLSLLNQLLDTPKTINLNYQLEHCLQQLDHIEFPHTISPHTINFLLFNSNIATQIYTHIKKLFNQINSWEHRYLEKVNELEYSEKLVSAMERELEFRIEVSEHLLGAKSAMGNNNSREINSPSSICSKRKSFIQLPRSEISSASRAHLSRCSSITNSGVTMKGNIESVDNTMNTINITNFEEGCENILETSVEESILGSPQKSLLTQLEEKNLHLSNSNTKLKKRYKLLREKYTTFKTKMHLLMENKQELYQKNVRILKEQVRYLTNELKDFQTSSTNNT